MASVRIYTTSWCSYCINAKRLLRENGIEFQEIDIEQAGISRKDLEKLTGRMTVPQIVVGDRPVGGYDDLLILAEQGELHEIVKDELVGRDLQTAE
ncbi:MAG: glutaredoxin domain-containing protein [Candidatus Neomarinimicrobiota bacterium]